MNFWHVTSESVLGDKEILYLVLHIALLPLKDKCKDINSKDVKLWWGA